MDAFSGIVAWLLVVFLQTCSVDHMAGGQVYTYHLTGKLRTVSITVDEYDARAKQAIVTARLDTILIDADARSHSAVLNWSEGRVIKEMQNEGGPMLEKPLKLPSPGLLMSSDPNNLFTPSKRTAQPAKPVKVEGYSGQTQPVATRYEHDKDYAEVSVDSTLGMVALSLKQWGELSSAQLMKVKR